MDIVRIGDKIISRRKLMTTMNKILKLRMLGISQLETARRLGVDRTFISRLEALGEIHKGGRIAVLGFPVANKQEVSDVLTREGVEFIYLLSEDERWRFVQDSPGPELLDKIVHLLAQLRDFDVVVLLGSEQRVSTIRTLLDQEVLELPIGQSPLKEDQLVPIDKLVALIRQVKANKMAQ